MRFPSRSPEALQVLLNQVVVAFQCGLNVHQEAVPVNAGLSLPVVVQFADLPEIDLAAKGFNDLDGLGRVHNRFDGNPGEDSRRVGLPDGLDPFGNRRRARLPLCAERLLSKMIVAPYFQ